MFSRAIRPLLKSSPLKNINNFKYVHSISLFSNSTTNNSNITLFNARQPYQIQNYMTNNNNNNDNNNTVSSFNFKENKTINKQQLKELISESEKKGGEKNYFLIDVRNPSEVENTGLIPTATHIPLGMLTAALSMSDSEYEETFNQNKFDISDNIIFYCLKGKRSEMAADLARNMGYRSVLNYPGSYEDWVSN